MKQWRWMSSNDGTGFFGFRCSERQPFLGRSGDAKPAVPSLVVLAACVTAALHCNCWPGISATRITYERGVSLHSVNGDIQHVIYPHLR